MVSMVNTGIDDRVQVQFPVRDIYLGLRDPAISKNSFRRFSFQLTCVHSILQLFGQCTPKIYLVTYLLM